MDRLSPNWDGDVLRQSARLNRISTAGHIVANGRSTMLSPVLDRRRKDSCR